MDITGEITVAKLTPMMKQYYEMKKKYKDAVLFFRMGDFYEMFGEDAKITSQVLGIVLTSRNTGPNPNMPMCGFPHHALNNYIGKMIEKGHKVALCEQLEDPKTAKGVVKRGVIRVYTSGTITEDTLLDDRHNNFLASIYQQNDQYAVSFVDVSTGEFLTAVINGENPLDKIATELAKFRPKECIIPHFLKDQEEFSQKILNLYNITFSAQEDYYFSYEHAYNKLVDHFKTINLEGFGIESLMGSICSSGAIISYLEETHEQSLKNIENIRNYSLADYLVLDPTTLRNLEVSSNIRDGKKTGTLLDVLDETITSMGARLVKKWLLQPETTVNEIKARQEAVINFYEDAFLLKDIRETLKQMGDLERLAGKIVSGSANGRDINALKSSIECMPIIQKSIEKCDSKRIQEINSDLSDLLFLAKLISEAIVDNPPVTIKEGGIILQGYNEELDELRDISQSGKSWIANLKEKEKERTGIKSLKIGFNKVFGYYIEVSKSNIKDIPENYIRKQTLANSERYITPDLKEYESKVLGAEEKINALEYEIFTDLREKIAKQSNIIRKNAYLIAQLDVYSNFAYIAKRNNYCCPEINNGDKIHIMEGRHPVVENMLGAHSYIPNDSLLNTTNHRFMLITGPNMAGKSTYMRQVAHIIIMAQIGCFVPAKKATVGIVDRIFTRVGAFDDLSSGQSTFMVEMNETANILHNATDKSLVLLDEIGRGTSTFDGLSIAWAVVEHIHNKGKIGAKTMFATHYHQLTQLENELEGLNNFNVAIKDMGDNLIFLRKLISGPADRSYGIEVARLAGFPEDVLNRAKTILNKLENKKENLPEEKEDKTKTEFIPVKPKEHIPQKSLFDFNKG